MNSRNRIKARYTYSRFQEEFSNFTVEGGVEIADIGHGVLQELA